MQFNIVTATRLLNDEQRNRPPVEDGPELVVESTTSTEPELDTAPAPNETIPENEHPEPAPIASAAEPRYHHRSQAKTARRTSFRPRNTCSKRRKIRRVGRKTRRPRPARPQFLTTGTGY